MASSDRDSVSVEEARRQIAGEGAQAIDIRGEHAWREGHVPGALLITREQLETKIEEIPDEGPVFVVADEGGEEVAATLRERGYDAAAIEGGMDAWKGADFTLQPSEDPDLPER
ncbi:MAG: rhodanese-like domain-containing protein [Solirubrobacterales bacterium]